MTTYHYADCDQFDDCATGWHPTPESAERSFWLENTFSPRERDRVQLYTRTVTDPTPEEWEEQSRLAKRTGTICVTHPEADMQPKAETPV